MESNSRKTKRSKIIFVIKNSSDCYVFMFLRKSEESDEELLHHRTTLNGTIGKGLTLYSIKLHVNYPM